MVNKHKITPEIQEMVAKLAREQVEKILVSELSSDTSNAHTVPTINEDKAQKIHEMSTHSFMFTNTEMQKLLVKTLAKKQLTQDQLASMVGCSRGVIAAIKNANRRVNKLSVLSVFETLGVKDKYEKLLESYLPSHEQSIVKKSSIKKIDDIDEEASKTLLHKVYNLFNKHIAKTSQNFMPLKVVMDNMEYNFETRATARKWVRLKGSEGHWSITSVMNKATGREMEIISMGSSANDQAAREVLMHEIRVKASNLLKKSDREKGLGWRDLQQSLRSVGANAANAKLGVAQLMKEGLVERYEKGGKVFVRLADHKVQRPVISQQELFSGRGLPALSEIEESESTDQQSTDAVADEYYIKTSIQNCHIYFSDKMRKEIRTALVSSNYSANDNVSQELLSERVKAQANKVDSIVNYESKGIQRHFKLNLTTVGKFLKGDVPLQIDDLRVLCSVVQKEELLGNLMTENKVEIFHLIDDK